LTLLKAGLTVCLAIAGVAAFAGEEPRPARQPEKAAVAPPHNAGQVLDPTEPVAGIPGLRFEPTGLSLLRPYSRGKVPVILVHGLWSSPWSWARTVAGLETDPALRDRYQFWTFGYSTGDPILYSAYLLRQNLREARLRFDPGGTDAAFDRMVVVGHSMGGLLAKVLVQDSRLRIWDLLCTRPPEALAGAPEDCDLLRQAVIFKPHPGVRRVVFIATPHRGSRLDQGAFHRLGTRLVRLPDLLQQAHHRLLASNGPGFFTPLMRDRLPTSVDQLAWEHPELLALCAMGIDPAVTFHSIIADLRAPPRDGGTDGVVPYASAHLDGAASEHLVSSGHLCQDRPAVIGEIRRILAEHQEP
jgi:pimeloyl-ACP methyl ester carboxylesterase